MKTLNLNIAKQWNDLTRKQLLFVCRLFLSNLDHTQFRMMAFLKLTGVKTKTRQETKDQVYYLFQKGRTRFKITLEEIAWFLRSVDFLTSESQLTRNLFPEFLIGTRKFYGPAKRCYDVRFLEFINAERCLYAFNKTREIKYLNQLCAVLYRPQKKNYHPLSPDYDGDRRERFNDFIYPRRAKWFKLVSLRKRYAVYIFYAGCRNALIKAHPKLFGSGSVSSEPVNPVESLQQTMRDLNMGDITKNKEIHEVQVWEAFGQLESMIIKTSKK